jgi:hypothetical protein
VALHFGGGSVAGAGPNGERQGDACGAEREAGGGARAGADEEVLVVVGDLGLGQGIEVGENLGPGCLAAEVGDALLELGLEDEREKLTKTWPRMVSSSLWKIGRVASRRFAVRKVGAPAPPPERAVDHLQAPNRTALRLKT